MRKGRFHTLGREDLREVKTEDSIRQVRWKKRKRRQTYSRIERILGMIDK